MKLRGICAIILMMCMMSVVTMLQPLKILLLALLLVLCIKDAKICPTNRTLCSFLCLSSIFGILVGFLSNTAYPLYIITVGVLWPISSLIIVTPLLKSDNDYRNMLKWMFYMHAVIIVYDILFAFHVVFGYSMINLYPEIEHGFSFYETTSRMNFVNLNTLTFTTPLFFLLYLTHYDFKVGRITQFIVLILNFFFLLFSGRRSLMAIFFLAPIFALIFRRYFPPSTAGQIKKYLVLVMFIAVVAIGYVYVYLPEVFDGYLLTFTKAFDSDVEDTKFLQADMLWEHFKENPIWGAGVGAEFKDPNRGVGHQFELTYLLVLATRGIIGFVLYILGTVGVLFVGIKYARRNNDVLFICMLFAFFFILLADATNPVLCSFDLMLPLFLCYAKINSCYYNKKYEI